MSLNSFTILIIISILFDPFFRCILLSEKRCHSLLIRLFTEPVREEVHSQTMITTYISCVAHSFGLAA